MGSTQMSKVGWKFRGLPPNPSTTQLDKIQHLGLQTPKVHPDLPPTLETFQLRALSHWRRSGRRARALCHVFHAHSHHQGPRAKIKRLNCTRGREFILMQVKVQEGRETDSENCGDLLPGSPDPSLACSNEAVRGDQQP